ncbi:hypothetical protein BOTBODRAFT_26706 [Botryobasidium botryosum FD-172 SS1]|uniref:Sucraseferredoxin-like protein n=1 Tax=Botryobasidium botryosum (strain FD-172 SS1) TaxID=930990 RepID=A0A067MYJ9_BOTB1|nr:hypothetical protein BOTBODRAFT_26706 [Botryobasidium botryosum FD-172 SS1]
MFSWPKSTTPASEYKEKLVAAAGAQPTSPPRSPPAPHRKSDDMLKSLITAVMPTHPTAEQLGARLEKCSVPVSLDPCRTCADPCDIGHAEYPKHFLNLASDMFGSVRAYGRQVVISTGASDWQRDIEDEKNSLAHYLSPVHHSLVRSTKKTAAPSASHVPGVFESAESTSLSILNGSHRTPDENNSASVIVLPDFKLVTSVDKTAKGAAELWKAALDPDVGRAGVPAQGNIRSFPLPYQCVVLICSHKRRSMRCHIAAPKLEDALITSLESIGWEAHTQPDDPDTLGPALETIPGSPEERDAAFVSRLKNVDDEYDQKRVLIVRVSHTGGHKYAGNMILCFPQGASVWYGKMTPHEVPEVVRQTIVGGKIMPGLLRGGMHLSRPDGKNIIDW